MHIQDLQEAYLNFTKISKGDLEVSGLSQPIQYILSLKSKKIRPLLAIIGYRIFRNDIEKCMHAAHGLELFHNFTLMHDDIMDEADLRRGKETVHKKFGNNAAILSGDAMSILAYQHILKDCSQSNALDVLSTFSQTALDICIGQQLDMEFEERTYLTSEEYIKMIRLKTAVFLGMALQLGALIAGKSTTESTPLYEYGTNLGIAFQIQDDLLDLIGDQEKVGKMKGGDIIRKKKTILITKALEIAPPAIKNQMIELLHSDSVQPELKVLKMTELMTSIGLFEVIEMEIKAYFKKADDQLSLLNISDYGRDLLSQLSGHLQQRKS